MGWSSTCSQEKPETNTWGFPQKSSTRATEGADEHKSLECSCPNLNCSQTYVDWQRYHRVLQSRLVPAEIIKRIIHMFLEFCSYFTTTFCTCLRQQMQFSDSHTGDLQPVSLYLLTRSVCAAFPQPAFTCIQCQEFSVCSMTEMSFLKIKWCFSYPQNEPVMQLLTACLMSSTQQD